MWGRILADRSPGLLRTRGPAVYDSGRHGATSTMTGVRLPQDPLEDPGGAVQSHIHLSRGYSERQGAPSRVSAGPVTVQGHRPPGLSAELCQETRRVDKWIKMLKRWDHYLPSEKEMKEAALVSSPTSCRSTWTSNRRSAVTPCSGTATGSGREPCSTFWRPTR
ncbi:uncharacterized protein [Canis lupus baileyi]|uniref:uncharacterized protein isoform X5 n=1 Tax=Canis lupus baileyi TaxID=143281 RepID=UPI003B96C236